MAKKSSPNGLGHGVVEVGDENLPYPWSCIGVHIMPANRFQTHWALCLGLA
ncbi:MAG: hypothetical protein LBJ75_00015 [Puniceicoccales bacterium]|nr:hypothetical protein [Puniceicoccales bacterium]